MQYMMLSVLLTEIEDYWKISRLSVDTISNLVFVTWKVGFLQE